MGTEEADSSLGGPETELENIEPLNLVHMRKLLNLVEFTQDFLSRLNAHLFMKWVHPFSCCIMELEHQYPSISGNYKLLTITINRADLNGFFLYTDLCKVSAHDADETEERRLRLVCLDVVNVHVWTFENGRSILFHFGGRGRG
ncbi:hypothetical protein AXG93_154s1400 [Marchantia polymorpha subsp. ruderalis]|uniref:DNA-PKcs N-terminal domain-containing protein n=1 Tax=Marchantia polymorpha subsp. ruderalis TaxID=1480154 RepID=A0A176VLM5_MARPO|nr:hypothetical protein AXG93_154s1400 [Marchantia polymorpha subsp. ruderalis]